MLLFCEPPMYGRLDAGQSATIATHQPADDHERGAGRRRSWPSRRRSGVGAASR